MKRYLYFKLILVSACFYLFVPTPKPAKAALSDAACATLIVTNLKTQNPAIDATEEARLIAYWTVICKGILDHIKTAGVVTGTATVSGGSSAGVHPVTGVVQ